MDFSVGDPRLIEKIVSEVKSQGIFDQFRRDCISDVDTKPAYQNLRQRVEISVGKFLSDQTWTPETNKIHLRERLRKHVTEAGFLETGVERIVDQVVNPKISMVFQPKIEDITYKYLGIEKPEKLNLEISSVNGNTQLNTISNNLEAVSPDSDKIDNSNLKNDFIDSNEKIDDEEESPPFEPLEGKLSPAINKEDSNASELSTISGLTSQDSVKTESKSIEEHQLSQISSSCSNEQSQLSDLNTNEEITVKQQVENDICEEAQMPKIFENLNYNESQSLHFDIRKNEIKFEGTERSNAIPNLSKKVIGEIDDDADDNNLLKKPIYEQINSISTENSSNKTENTNTAVNFDDPNQLQATEKSNLSSSNNNKNSEENNLKLEEDIDKNETTSKKANIEKNDLLEDLQNSTSNKIIDKYEQVSTNDKIEFEIRTLEKNENSKQDDDHFLARKKVFRRKSNDSNDSDNVKDFKNNLKTNIQLITSEKNSTNQNNCNLETKTSSSNTQQLSENKSASNFLYEQEKKTIFKNDTENLRNKEDCEESENRKLMSNKINDDDIFFDPAENENMKIQVDKLNEIINKSTQELYVSCEDEYKDIFRNMSSVQVNEIKFINGIFQLNLKNNSYKSSVNNYFENNIEEKKQKKLHSKPFSNQKNKTFSSKSSLKTADSNKSLSCNNVEFIDDTKFEKKDELLNFGIGSTNVSLNDITYDIKLEDKVCVKDISGDHGNEYIPLEKRKSNSLRCSQRYSNEDLYKPRFPLIQRSRKRRANFE